MATSEFREGFELYGSMGSPWTCSVPSPVLSSPGTWPTDPLEALGWMVMHARNSKYHLPAGNTTFTSIVTQKLGWIGSPPLGAGPGIPQDDDAWMKMIQRELRGTYDEAWQFQRGADVLLFQTFGAIRLPYCVEVTVKARIPADGDEGAQEPARTHRILEHLLIGFEEPLLGTVSAGSAWIGGNVGTDLWNLGRWILRGEGTPIKRLRQWVNWSTSIEVCDQPQRWEFRGVRHKIDNAIRIPYVTKKKGEPRKAHLLIGYEGGGAY